MADGPGQAQILHDGAHYDLGRVRRHAHCGKYCDGERDGRRHLVHAPYRLARDDSVGWEAVVHAESGSAAGGDGE